MECVYCAVRTVSLNIIQDHVRLVVEEVAKGRVSLTVFISPCQYLSTNASSMCCSYQKDKPSKKQQVRQKILQHFKVFHKQQVRQKILQHFKVFRNIFRGEKYGRCM